MPEAPTNEADLGRLAAEVRREVDALVSIMAETVDVQWLPSPVPRPREDTTERSKGGHGDPTPSITLDDRRLRVRQGVIAAAHDLRMTADVCARVRVFLESAADAWAGHE